ncbi:SDR family NAD(P)-dependent oxidoreductase [Antarcticirhabdus aurantiaca]|uniref:SDR family oxidoreductase n=1 Tax=Antarcticirhabdus aurantiaca TaxID=2606717 RepID=A0ACD4NUU7_9HYPH|nr:SDR family NAD(P)-dependent oxidoreductase [Antarcticirhabdus aurantiaca]WAJ30342.1 SDR family oxidoreductase [Jeongeuplla avenae]
MRSLPEGFRAVVIGRSGGIGSAVAARLEADPRCGEVVGLSRAEGFDLLDEASIEAAARRLASTGGPLDLVFDATGALQIDGYGPEKTLRALGPAGMAMQFAVNAIGPALVLKHFAPLLPRERRGLFATLSARVGSIGDNRLGGWISYRSAKAALNQIVRTAAIEIARTHPRAVVVALHPGTVATRLSDPFAGQRDRLSPDAAAAALLETLDGMTPERTGTFHAYDGSSIAW